MGETIDLLVRRPGSYDKDQFIEDFSAHVLAHPEHDDHARFVTREGG